MGIAQEYRDKMNHAGIPERFLKARESLWEYNKLIKIGRAHV